MHTDSGLAHIPAASRIGISQAAYPRQEKNFDPGEYVRERIANALGLSPELLLSTWDDEPQLSARRCALGAVCRHWMCRSLLKACDSA
ncbi:hypothetical protein D8I24_0287 (plasmid) [Cupriavidus necator H850]|uniref:hypothetical protein n=1 Tax=Cupriavidus necator TaxID=106590 RepID=UPI001892BB7A|nr:hypothetical protein [Cupriavidus necator]KAI3611138.1 hypothetical protein D8I24_0287 [Cupriavidus necator H850]